MNLNEIAAPEVTIAILIFARDEWADKVKENRATTISPSGVFFTSLIYPRLSLSTIIVERTIVKQWNIRGYKEDQLMRLFMQQALPELMEPYKPTIGTLEYQSLERFTEAIHTYKGRYLRLILLAENETRHPTLALVASAGFDAGA